ncbi:MAG: electron transfer flavoprotein subunit beta [Verrucomicrobiae bacterium]|nr:electron transfer flavoprotein subunit beta [Verrucomicrobiae bacterium]
MKYYVLIKMVPDTVEELVIGPDGKSLDVEAVRPKLADSDDHAIEEALLLREKHGGEITVVALESPEVDDVLFTALAKGVNQAVKLTGDWNQVGSLGAARVFAQYLAPNGQLPPESLVMLRSQAYDDLEGEIGPCLAELLGVPFMGVVTKVTPAGGQVTVTKEFAGGLRGEFNLPLPCVLGIQSAEKPPRYVPIAKVRAAQKTAKIEEVEGAAPEAAKAYEVERMYLPEAAGRAQMLEGSVEEVADKVVEVLAQNSLL